MSAAHKLAQRARARDVDAARVRWPDPAWRGRIIEFARDVLGIRTLASHQREILEAYQADENAAILGCTGQKDGKTESLIISDAYDFATEPSVKVWLYAPKVDHTNAVHWPRFVPMMLGAYLPCQACRSAHEAWCALMDADPLDETRRPDRCPSCSPLIPSTLKNPKRPELGRVSEWLNATDAEAGLRAPDGRSVRAYTGRKEGSKGGFSGKLRLKADECSDIPDLDRETWAGNLVGGGKLMGFGNLLHFHGWFANAFKPSSKEAARWTKRVQLSSRLSPNCRGRIHWSDGAVTENGRWLAFPGGSTKRPLGYVDNPHAPDERPIRGMATPEGIEKNLKAWAGSNYIPARIDAVPPEIVVGQLASMGRVAAAEQRWPIEEPAGILQFGVDVARVRDKFVIAPRRGNSIRELIAEVLGEDDYARAVDMLFEASAKYRRPHERKPRLVYDASGKEGQRFRKELDARKASDHFDVYPIYSTFKPKNCKLYDKKRDELACHFAEWLKFGSIPADAELEAEIEATTAKRVEVSYASAGNRWEVQRVITNDELRPILGRSPDKRNACELAAWDVDGSETVSPEPTATESPAPNRIPANDLVMSATSGDIADRVDAFTRMAWGRA